mmetsp:Transcript_32357/g.43047  ORF Transcript_32357/g.43047 Transcript_32357/m.43047 type:complete len:129 (-) Transcript_32357:262-648(-)
MNHGPKRRQQKGSCPLRRTMTMPRKDRQREKTIFFKSNTNLSNACTMQSITEPHQVFHRRDIVICEVWNLAICTVKKFPVRKIKWPQAATSCIFISCHSIAQTQILSIFSRRLLLLLLFLLEDLLGFE